MLVIRIDQLGGLVDVRDATEDIFCQGDAASPDLERSALDLDPCLAYTTESECTAATCHGFTFYRSCSGMEAKDPVYFCSAQPPYRQTLERWDFMQLVDDPTSCYAIVHSYRPLSPAWQNCRAWILDHGQCLLTTVGTCEGLEAVFGQGNRARP